MANGNWHWQEQGTVWKGIGNVTLTVPTRESKKPVEFSKPPRLKKRISTYRAKGKTVSDFLGLK